MRICRDDLAISRGAASERTVAIDRRGFTLVELMVTLVILGLSSVFIYQIFITQHDSYMAQQDVSEAQQDVRASLDMLVRELRSVGYGVPGGGTGITATTDGGDPTIPDSITFQTAQAGSTAASTFLTADATGPTIDVKSTNGFTSNNKVNVLNVVEKNQLGGAMYTITTVSGTTQLILSGTPPAKQGDLVVSAGSTTVAVQTIAYALVADGNNPGTYLLQRTSTVNGTETLADHILNLQIQYTLSGGGAAVATVAAANLNSIRTVQVTLTTQTLKNLAKAGSGSESGYRLGQRSLTSLIRIKNS